MFASARKRYVDDVLIVYAHADLSSINIFPYHTHSVHSYIYDLLYDQDELTYICTFKFFKCTGQKAVNRITLGTPHNICMQVIGIQLNDLLYYPNLY